MAVKIPESSMPPITFPPKAFIEPTHADAVTLVETGNLSYSAFSTPIPLLHVSTRDQMCTCDVLSLGDVLLSLHVFCDGLKSVEFSLYGTPVHAAYFAKPHAGKYEIRIPVCLLNTTHDALSLVLARAPGATVQSVVATYVLTRSEERLSLAAMMPPSVPSSFDKIDIALGNGTAIARAFFEQDGVFDQN